jgi:hypothetical protein
MVHRRSGVHRKGHVTDYSCRQHLAWLYEQFHKAYFKVSVNIIVMQQNAHFNLNLQ